MSKLFLLPSSLSTVHSFTSILSKDNLKKYALE